MKRSRVTSFEDYEKRVSTERSKKKAHTVPKDLLVQRMSSNPSGRLKVKYDPLDTRDFVPFENFYELSLRNIKRACEIFYNMPEGSCDVLASDRGPSCTDIDQIKGKKFYMIRFLENTAAPLKETAGPSRPNSVPAKSCSFAAYQSRQPQPPASKFAKSLSIGEMLRAGKLIKKEATCKLELEYFSIDQYKWRSHGLMEIMIEKERFANGNFRDAFKATSPSSEDAWVVKKYNQKAVEEIKTVLDSSPEDHARKQVQMHAIARNIAQRFQKSAPQEFGVTFEYQKVYYSIYEGQPVTIEKYVDGSFHKYINNDGQCAATEIDEIKAIYEKAQTLVHFSYILSEKKFMLVDLQGSGYQLYDPEIATLQHVDNDEIFFCAGNLSKVAFDTFKKEHKCGTYCKLMKLPEL